MLSRYESDKKEITVLCPTCKKSNIILLNQLQLYASTTPGVLIIVPACECGTRTQLYTGTGVGTDAGHAINCVAKAAFKLGTIVPDRPFSVEDKLDSLESKYDDELKRNQFMEKVSILWEANKAGVPG